MALIKCPECGKEVSDKAPACIHCGYPLNNLTNTQKQEEPVKNEPIPKIRVTADTVMQAVDRATSQLKCSIEELDYTVIDQGKQGIFGSRPAIIEATKKHNNEPKINITWHTPKCPTCQSADIKKISDFSKAGSVAVWGVLAAGKVSKQWHCNNCGSEW